MKTLAVLAAFMLAGCATLGQPTMSVTPTSPGVIAHVGAPHPVSLLPGTGVSLGADFWPTTFFGAPVHLLSLGGDAFGSLVAAAQLAGGASIGPHIGLYDAFVLMGGVDLYTNDKTGIFGTFSKQNLYYGLGLDFALLQRMFLGHQQAMLPATSTPAVITGTNAVLPPIPGASVVEPLQMKAGSILPPAPVPAPARRVAPNPDP